MKITGNLEIKDGDKTDYSNITEVTGSVYVYGSAKLDALTTVGGNVYVDGSAKLDALTTVGGYVSVYGSEKLDAPNLETVGDYVSVYGSAKLDAPNLETVGDYVSVYGSAKLDALTTVGGNVYVDGSAKLDALTTVGGYVSVYGSAKLDAPNIKEKDTDKSRAKAVKKLAQAFKKKKLIKVDGILSWLVSKKIIGTVVTMKVKVVGKLSFSFVVQKGDVFSHGKTIKEAKDSLKYKISSRDTSEFKKWKLDTVVTQAKMIQAYRAITGACEFGVKNFCEQREVNLPNKLSVKKALEITDGAYGSDQFARFFR